MSVTLDISSAQFSALSDYSRGSMLRYPLDFVTHDMTECMICDDLHGATLMSHIQSSSHRKLVHEYNSCMHSLNIEDRRAYALSDAPVSRREVVVAYLANRLLNADGVHGTDRFNRAAVAFLLHRMTVSGLLQAFKTVHGSERMVRNGVCIVCMERTTSMMFSECHHACMCINCAVRLRGEASSEDAVSCPVCRKECSIVPVYIS